MTTFIRSRWTASPTWRALRDTDKHLLTALVAVLRAFAGQPPLAGVERVLAPL